MKTRSRRSAPISKAAAKRALVAKAVTPAGKELAARAAISGARASAGTASAGTASAPERSEADEFVQRILSGLWAGVESGDPLRAEIETSTCMGIPYVLGQRDPAEIESFISTVLVDGAVRRETPDGAAVGVATNAGNLIEAMSHHEDEFDRSEQISLAEARRHMEGPLTRSEQDPDPGLSTETVAYLPLARTRIRGLPAEDGEPAKEFT